MFMVIWDIESMARDNEKKNRMSRFLNSVNKRQYKMHASIHSPQNVCLNLRIYTELISPVSVSVDIYIYIRKYRTRQLNII